MPSNITLDGCFIVLFKIYRSENEKRKEKTSSRIEIAAKNGKIVGRLFF